MSSQVDIANLALSIAGTRSTVSNLNERSAEARNISLQYDNALGAVLKASWWNFARRQQALTLLKDATAGDTTVPAPWLYEYAYPSDCVQVRFLLPSIAGTSPLEPNTQASALPTYIGAPVRFVSGTDLDTNGNDTRVILTNQPNAIAIYTKRILDPTLYDDSFVHAFAGYLAHLVIMPLTGDKQRAQYAFQYAQNAINAAAVENGDEGLTIVDNQPDWIRVRGYASDWAYPQGDMYFNSPAALTQVI